MFTQHLYYPDIPFLEKFHRNKPGEMRVSIFVHRDKISKKLYGFFSADIHKNTHKVSLTKIQAEQ
ncbi:MAG: hypothetical protein HQL29_01625 [Candidatus Omnitrophica bacterium]|nr:hypothetical protein [Candidatus Omnitrophota bacterium]